MCCVHHTLLHIKITFDGRGLKKFPWDQLHISDRCSILALAAEQSYGLSGYFCLYTWAAFDWRRVGWWLTEGTIRRKTASCHNCYHDRHPSPSSSHNLADQRLKYRIPVHIETLHGFCTRQYNLLRHARTSSLLIWYCLYAAASTTRQYSCPTA